jgi:hypothetical protein
MSSMTRSIPGERGGRLPDLNVAKGGTSATPLSPGWHTCAPLAAVDAVSGMFSPLGEWILTAFAEHLYQHPSVCIRPKWNTLATDRQLPIISLLRAGRHLTTIALASATSDSRRCICPQRGLCSLNLCISLLFSSLVKDGTVSAMGRLTCRWSMDWHHVCPSRAA